MIFIVTHPLATGHPSSPVLYWLGWSFDPKNCKKHWKKIYDTYLAFSCLCPQCSQVVSGNQLNPPSIQEKRLCCSIASRHITWTRFPTRRFSRNSNRNGTLQRRDRGNRTVSNIQTMKLPQGSEMNPANSVKPEERRGSKNGRYKSVKSAQTNARPSIYMRPGYRTKSHSPGQDLEGNQDSPRVGKIFVDLRLAIKDLMQSKCHSFLFSISFKFSDRKKPIQSPGGGAYSTKCHTGRLSAEVQPL